MLVQLGRESIFSETGRFVQTFFFQLQIITIVLQLPVMDYYTIFRAIQINVFNTDFYPKSMYNDCDQRKNFLLFFLYNLF